MFASAQKRMRDLVMSAGGRSDGSGINHVGELLDRLNWDHAVLLCSRVRLARIDIINGCELNRRKFGVKTGMI